MPRRHESGPR